MQSGPFYLKTGMKPNENVELSSSVLRANQIAISECILPVIVTRMVATVAAALTVLLTQM